MNSKNRFVQICTSAANNVLELYALDESGRVWRFNDAQLVWVLLPCDRAEVVTK